MSPNKRAENKKKLTFWLDSDLYDRFAKVSDFFGMTMTSILTAYIIEKIDEYEDIVKRRATSVSRGEDSESSKGERNDR